MDITITLTNGEYYKYKAALELENIASNNNQTEIEYILSQINSLVNKWSTDITLGAAVRATTILLSSSDETFKKQVRTLIGDTDVSILSSMVS